MSLILWLVVGVVGFCLACTILVAALAFASAAATRDLERRAAAGDDDAIAELLDRSRW